MSAAQPIVYLARHGETAWSVSCQHTRLTDLPLTERGERTAKRLGERLGELTFVKVWTSALQRAARACELAGLGAVATVDSDLVEWDYGEYEGRRGVLQCLFPRLWPMCRCSEFGAHAETSSRWLLQQ